MTGFWTFCGGPPCGCSSRATTGPTTIVPPVLTWRPPSAHLPRSVTSRWWTTAAIVARILPWLERSPWMRSS